MFLKRPMLCRRQPPLLSCRDLRACAPGQTAVMTTMNGQHNRAMLPAVPEMGYALVMLRYTFIQGLSLKMNHASKVSTLFVYGIRTSIIIQG
jgi:hypothetical protein